MNTQRGINTQKGMKEKMRKWVEENWGKRCSEPMWGCPSCQAWLAFDYLFGYEDDEEEKGNA